jgi:hypothetical protein
MKRIRLVKAAMRKKAPSPLGAVMRGILAGAIGAGAQSLFFKATQRWAPTPTKLPPELQELEAKDESSLQTVARRTWSPS